MTRQLLKRASCLVPLVALAGAILAGPAFAQGPGGGFGGPGGGRPGGGFGGPPPASVAQLPLSLMDTELKLTADQKTKITTIQQQFQTQRKADMPAPGDAQSGPPDREAMRADMEKVRALDQTASDSIKAVLTDSQKLSLDTLLSEVNKLRMAGIPTEIYGDLKLTADQKTKIDAIADAAQKDMRAKMDAARDSGDFSSMRDTMRQAHEDTVTKTMAVLTDAQKALVTKFNQDHPRPQFGGPGFGGGRGPGGPGHGGGGDPGGPPPGDGGPGGGGPPPPGGPDGGGAPPV